jgi:hypothetical protein
VDDVLKMPLLEFRFCSMFQFQEWTFYSDSDSDFLVVDDEAATSVLEYLWIIKLDFFYLKRKFSVCNSLTFLQCEGWTSPFRFKCRFRLCG